MKTFWQYLRLRLRETEEPAPPGVDPETWQFASERMRNYLRTQAAGQVPQAPSRQPEPPPTYNVRMAARSLGPTRGPIRGQTGQGLESIPAGGRVPPDLVAQISPEDIAPSWVTATKYYKGRDGKVYKK